MNTKYKLRLLKLMRHLRHGKLGHKVFDFSRYNDDGRSKDTPYKCGTNGCAMGECPIVWPKEWCFDGDGDPVLVGMPTSSISGRKWFGISNDEYEHLFIPISQSPDLYGGKPLDSDATREQVADGIEAFIKKKES